jgi:short-subunit dehydrogenase
MIARGYAENGARVYVSSRDADACAKVAAELSKVGTCAAIPGDLAKPPR